MAAPTLRGPGPGNTGNGTSIAVTLATHQTNDILVVQIDVLSNPTVTIPSGWNLLREQLLSTTFKQGLYWKRAASASEATPTFTIGATAQQWAANSQAWVGADDIGASIIPSTGLSGTGTARASSTGGGTLVGDQPNMTHVVTIGALAGTDDAMTPATSHTEGYETDNGTLVSSQMSYRPGVGPGPVPSVFTTGTVSVGWIGQSFLLRSTDFATYRAHVKLATAAAANAVFTLPTGVATNDILLALIEKDNTAAITAPAGWTALVNDADTSGAQTQHVYVTWKRHTAGDAAPTFSWTGSIRRTASLVAYYRAVASGSPIAAQSALAKSAGTTALATNAAATTRTLTTLLGIWHNWAVTTGTTNWTPQAGTNERIEGDGFYLADVFQVAAGPTVALSATCITSGKTVDVLLVMASTASADGTFDSFPLDRIRPGARVTVRRRR